MSKIPSRRVLLVEDRPILLLGLRQALIIEGIDVVDVATADEAIRQFEQDPSAFDALVCDIVLPDGSGIEVAERIVRIVPNFPIVLISGGCAEPLDSKWPPLIKPFQIHQLIQILRNSWKPHDTASDDQAVPEPHLYFPMRPSQNVSHQNPQAKDRPAKANDAASDTPPKSENDERP